METEGGGVTVSGAHPNDEFGLKSEMVTGSVLRNRPLSHESLLLSIRPVLQSVGVSVCPSVCVRARARVCVWTFPAHVVIEWREFRAIPVVMTGLLGRHVGHEAAFCRLLRHSNVVKTTFCGNRRHSWHETMNTTLLYNVLPHHRRVYQTDNNGTCFSVCVCVCVCVSEGRGRCWPLVVICANQQHNALSQVNVTNTSTIDQNQRKINKQKLILVGELGWKC